MLIDQLREQVKEIQHDIKTIELFWQRSGIDVKCEAYKERVHQENFWQDSQRDVILKEYTHIKDLSERYHELMQAYKDYSELIELFADSEQELVKIEPDIYQFCRRVRNFKLELLLNKDEDRGNCYVSINAGAGGTESQDWASMLLRMYLRFCEREGFNVSIIDYQPGEEAGIKSAVLYIKGKNAAGLLKSEHGIHRLVRISPFDANKRRHTSFAGVTLMPERDDVKVEIDEKDLRIDTYRASGAGGQHVNKTDSAVRITHLPTGIVVQCQNERSQLRNKQTAMKLLEAKLAEREEEKREAENKKVERKKIEWGSQIRSYVLHPYKMVKDHRTDKEHFQPDLVLDGDLMAFIEAYLVDAGSSAEQ